MGDVIKGDFEAKEIHQEGRCEDNETVFLNSDCRQGCNVSDLLRDFDGLNEDFHEAILITQSDVQFKGNTTHFALLTRSSTEYRPLKDLFKQKLTHALVELDNDWQNKDFLEASTSSGFAQKSFTSYSNVFRYADRIGPTGLAIYFALRNLSYGDSFQKGYNPKELGKMTNCSTSTVRKYVKILEKEKLIYFDINPCNGELDLCKFNGFRVISN